MSLLLYARDAARRRRRTSSPVLRALLTVLPACWLLLGCAGLPTPEVPDSAEGRRLLQDSAVAHGRAGLAQLHDINVAYVGTWAGLVKRLQPVLVDERHRAGSDERILVAEGVTGQRHTGPGGDKQVHRDAASIEVWRNEVPDGDRDALDAAALVADDYRLFLLGTMLLERTATAVSAIGSVTIEGRECYRLLVTLEPGLGRSARDRLELAIDHETHLLRRLRLSLDGLHSTRGAIAQIDLSDYVRLRGVAWPTHFVESLVRPIPGLPMHDWRVVGIDFDRGYQASDISGPAFLGAAAPRAGSR